MCPFNRCLGFCLFGFGTPKDQVKGYNIVVIQDALITRPNTWNDWKNNIKTFTINDTKQHLDALFGAWDNY